VASDLCLPLLQKPPKPDSPEVRDYKAVVDTVIELLNNEAELIETGKAPTGSATNVNLIIHDLLPCLAQQRLQPTTDRHQLLERKGELCLLAELLKETQKGHTVLVRSTSDLEVEDEVSFQRQSRCACLVSVRIHNCRARVPTLHRDQSCAVSHVQYLRCIGYIGHI